jgi:hypothetical protein
MYIDRYKLEEIDDGTYMIKWKNKSVGSLVSTEDGAWIVNLTGAGSGPKSLEGKYTFASFPEVLKWLGAPSLKQRRKRQRTTIGRREPHGGYAPTTETRESDV